MRALEMDVRVIKAILTQDSMMSHREVAKVLGMTRGQVWHIEERALQKIINLLSENPVISKSLSEYLN